MIPVPVNPNPYLIFTSGCIGALSPEIVRLYRLRYRSSQFQWAPSYFLISLLFSLLGGFVAWSLQATTYYGAFYAGVALPVIISSILKEKEVPAHLHPLIDPVDFREELLQVMDKKIAAITPATPSTSSPSLPEKSSDVGPLVAVPVPPRDDRPILPARLPSPVRDRNAVKRSALRPGNYVANTTASASDAAGISKDTGLKAAEGSAGLNIGEPQRISPRSPDRDISKYFADFFRAL